MKNRTKEIKRQTESILARRIFIEFSVIPTMSFFIGL